jgi:hypothetical protein
MGKARMGPYLPICLWLDKPRTTNACGVAAALLRPANICSSTAAVTMWRDIGKATRSDDPEHLYGTALQRRKMHSGPAILEFLAQTEVGSTARLQTGRFWEDREE